MACEITIRLAVGRQGMDEEGEGPEGRETEVETRDGAPSHEALGAGQSTLWCQKHEKMLL